LQALKRSAIGKSSASQVRGRGFEPQFWKKFPLFYSSLNFRATF
jgi:hypothetical protein